MAFSPLTDETRAAQLIVASPWWSTIMIEEKRWIKRAQRVHACIATQALAFQNAAYDIERLFITIKPSKDMVVCSVASHCAHAFTSMANVFASINVYLKQLLDTHNSVLMIENFLTDPFMSHYECGLGDLLQSARCECMCIADIFEKRFPLLAPAIQAAPFVIND